MKEDIIKVVEKYQEVIHSQNKEDFYKLWSSKQKCSLISIVDVFYGRDHIYQDFLIDKIQNAYSSIDLINDGIEINLINDHLAIVVFKYHTQCIKRMTGESYGIEGLETQVMIKEDDSWKLLHVHYSK